jgi:hypothetical protein
MSIRKLIQTCARSLTGKVAAFTMRGEIQSMHSKRKFTCHHKQCLIDRLLPQFFIQIVFDLILG